MKTENECTCSGRVMCPFCYARGEKPRATRRNEWAAPAPSGSASGSPKSSSPDG